MRDSCGCPCTGILSGCDARKDCLSAARVSVVYAAVCGNLRYWLTVPAGKYPDRHRKRSGYVEHQAHKAEYMRIAWAGSGTPDGGLPAPGAPGCPEGKYEEVIWVREKDREGITRL